MAKFLFATVGVSGHITPGLPIAAQLVQQGHEVGWYTTSKYEARIEATGARFYKVQEAKDFDDSHMDEAFPGRAAVNGIKQLKFDFKHFFFGEMLAWNRDLERILKEFPADVIVIDAAFSGTLPMLLNGTAPRVAAYGIVPLTVSSRDTAPFGFGLPPKSTAAGRFRNQLMNAFVENMAFGDVQKYVNKLLAGAGVKKPLPCFFLNSGPVLSDLYLQGTCPSFEYPRSDMPESVRFVGPFLPKQPVAYEVPAWWNELNGDKPVVHVTQGTISNVDFGQLLIPTFEALADEDVLVVATTGGRPTNLVNVPLPANVRLEPYIPYHELLPRVDVMVTNGGYGGVQQAILNGIPLVVAGVSEDKREVNARVGWAGVGINLKTDRPKPEQIQRAVNEVLGNASYQTAVSRLALEFQSYDAHERATEELVKLAVG